MFRPRLGDSKFGARRFQASSEPSLNRLSGFGSTKNYDYGRKEGAHPLQLDENNSH